MHPQRVATTGGRGLPRGPGTHLWEQLAGLQLHVSRQVWCEPEHFEQQVANISRTQAGNTQPPVRSAGWSHARWDSFARRGSHCGVSYVS